MKKTRGQKSRVRVPLKTQLLREKLTVSRIVEDNKGLIGEMIVVLHDNDDGRTRHY
jgi:hypothetical protein